MIGLNNVSSGISTHVTPWSEPSAKTGKHPDVTIPDKLWPKIMYTDAHHAVPKRLD